MHPGRQGRSKGPTLGSKQNHVTTATHVGMDLVEEDIEGFWIPEYRKKIGKYRTDIPANYYT